MFYLRSSSTLRKSKIKRLEPKSPENTILTNTKKENIEKPPAWTASPEKKQHSVQMSPHKPQHNHKNSHKCSSGEVQIIFSKINGRMISSVENFIIPKEYKGGHQKPLRSLGKTVKPEACNREIRDPEEENTNIVGETAQTSRLHATYYPRCIPNHNKETRSHSKTYEENSNYFDQKNISSKTGKEATKQSLKDIYKMRHDLRVSTNNNPNKTTTSLKVSKNLVKNSNNQNGAVTYDDTKNMSVSVMKCSKKHHKMSLPSNVNVPTKNHGEVQTKFRSIYTSSNTKISDPNSGHTQNKPAGQLSLTKQELEKLEKFRRVNLEIIKAVSESSKTTLPSTSTDEYSDSELDSLEDLKTKAIEEEQEEMTRENALEACIFLDTNYPNYFQHLIKRYQLDVVTTNKDEITMKRLDMIRIATQDKDNLERLENMYNPNIRFSLQNTTCPNK